MFTNSLVFAAGLIGDLYNPGAMLPTLCKKVVGFFLRINETLKKFIYFKLCFSSQTKISTFLTLVLKRNFCKILKCA